MSKKENFTPPEEEAADAEIPLSLTCNRQEWVPALVNGNIDSLNLGIEQGLANVIHFITQLKNNTIPINKDDETFNHFITNFNIIVNDNNSADIPKFITENVKCTFSSKTGLDSGINPFYPYEIKLNSSAEDTQPKFEQVFAEHFPEPSAASGGGKTRKRVRKHKRKQRKSAKRKSSRKRKTK
jgi:hypothetical protein